METHSVSNVRKIAVLRANALGDFIFVLPALQAIKETYPSAEIVYLGKPWHKSFLANRPIPLDRVIVIPVSKGVREEKGKQENPEQLATFFQAMRQEKFDIALQLHGGGRYSNPFLKKLGARLTVGLRTPDAELLDRWIPYIYYQNEILRYLEVVSLIGAKTTQIAPALSATAADLEETKQIIGDVTNPYIVLHPGSTDIRRRWPAEKFAVVGDTLVNMGYQILITGTEKEANTVQEVLDHMQHNVVNICSKLSLSGLTGILSKATLLISNDTGPLHLAEVLHTPTVGLYWCGNLINAAPITRKLHRPLLSWMIHCPLCGLDIASPGYPFHANKTACHHAVSFIDGITVQGVITAANDLLSMTNQKAEKTTRHKETKDTLQTRPSEYAFPKVDE